MATKPVYRSTWYTAHISEKRHGPSRQMVCTDEGSIEGVKKQLCGKLGWRCGVGAPHDEESDEWRAVGPLAGERFFVGLRCLEDVLREGLRI